MSYTSIMAAIVAICIYFAVKAIADQFSCCWEIFSLKGGICVIVGAILGGFISTPLFNNVSSKAGYIGMGIGFAIAYTLFYTHLISWLISLIPENIRRGFRRAFEIGRVVVILAVITASVVGILSLVGV